MSNSNSKDDIGELLWSLQFPIGRELQQLGWALLERLLRRYIERTVPLKRLSEPSQSSKSGKGGIR